MCNNIMEVRGLSKNYGGFVLNDLSFDLPAGYIMGLIGPNGAGKTTTIKLILQALKSDAGSVKLFGSEVSDVENEQIGVVLDAPLYVEEWTIADLEKALAPFYQKWDQQVFADLLKQFRLNKKQKIGELSRGMKVKLQIAVALSHHAILLILDEPTSGLDPVAREEIGDLLREFIADENRSVMFSTHITSDLEKIADYLTFIMDGRIVFTGAKDALLEKYARATGGLADVNEEHKKSLIGYREYGTGFEGMVEVGDLKKLPASVLLEELNLEEIIIFMNRGAQQHE